MSFSDPIRWKLLRRRLAVSAPHVIVRSLLVISENARVRGKVSAGHVIINGTVEGPVVSDVLLELQPKARVLGDVRYDTPEMHQGASLDGELKPLKSTNRPALTLAASNDA